MLPQIRTPNASQKKLVFNDFYKLVRKVNEDIIFDKNTFIEKDFGGKRYISGNNTGGSGISFADFAFGIKSISSKEVTFNGGTVYHFPNSYDVAETVVTVGGGLPETPLYVVVQYTHRASAAIMTTALSAVPANTSGYSYVWIAKMYLGSSGVARTISSGGVSCNNIYIGGNIYGD